MVPHDRSSTSPLPSLAIVWLLRSGTNTFAETLSASRAGKAH